MHGNTAVSRKLFGSAVERLQYGRFTGRIIITLIKGDVAVTVTLAIAGGWLKRTGNKLEYRHSLRFTIDRNTL